MAAKRSQDGDAATKMSPLLRIIVKLFTIYMVVSTVIAGFVAFLFFKFIVGWSFIGSLAAVGGVVALVAISAKYLPDEEPSILDLFD